MNERNRVFVEIGAENGNTWEKKKRREVDGPHLGAFLKCGGGGGVWKRKAVVESGVGRE